MKKIILLVAVLLIATLSLSLFVACGPGTEDPNYEPPSFLRADGIRIVDGDGNPVGLYGTNLGGWLVQEEWLCPTEVEGDIAQIDIMLTLYNRFGQEKAEELIAVHESNWVTEQDFAAIKEIGLNCVRIPFTYMNLMNVLTYDQATETWVTTDYKDLAFRDDAFERLDWALEMCDKYDLYAILDLHGAVGSQSGQDHTGDISEKVGRLWRDDEIGEACRQKTKELWVEIAKRYQNNDCVAAYDLMNEPGIATIDGSGNKSQTTADKDKKVWNYFDELIKAIREVDKNHMISVESCWESFALPSLDEYGWENMLYQYHHYNWASTNILNSTFYNTKVLTIDMLANRDYPVLIGEFNVWADTHPDKNKYNTKSDQTEAEAWAGVMELYCGKGWSFTTWNFKHAAGNSSWGLFNFNDGEVDYKQADFYNDSYDDISAAWASHNSTNYHENTALTACIKPYLENFYTGSELKETTEQYYILDNIEE